MKRVINDKKLITISELVDILQMGAKCVVYYMARCSADNESYPVFFKKMTDSPRLGDFGFVAPIFTNGTSYVADTIRESLQKAVDGGKELIVLERNEVDQLFKKIK